MKVTTEAKKMMYSWLLNRYGMLEAIKAVDTVADELDRHSYAILSIGDETVNARPSTKTLSKGTPGVVGQGVRIWVNE